jgi:hypothetical protein
LADRLSLIGALEAANIAREHAERIVSEIADFVTELLRRELAETRARWHDEITEMRIQLRDDVRDLRNDQRENFQAINRSIGHMAIGLGAALVGAMIAGFALLTIASKFLLK